LLIFSTFCCPIFGTFLTRSGVVSSVHAFAQSSIGTWFVAFMALVFAVCAYFYVAKPLALEERTQAGIVISRESSFLFNNLLFVVACFTVLWERCPGALGVGAGHESHGRASLLQPRQYPGGAHAAAAHGVRSAACLGTYFPRKPQAQLPVAGSRALTVAILCIAFGMRPWKDISYFTRWWRFR